MGHDLALLLFYNARLAQVTRRRRPSRRQEEQHESLHGLGLVVANQAAHLNTHISIHELIAGVALVELL